MLSNKYLIIKNVSKKLKIIYFVIYVNTYIKKMNNNVCIGDGMCLAQDSNNEYVKKLECEYNCEPVKCPNFVVCGSINPLCILNCHRRLCTNCDSMFGTWQSGHGILNLRDNIECCICLETKIGISYPRCDHYICIDDFKRCFYVNEPVFPYSSDVEDEYYEDPDNQKWLNDELIQKYIYDCEEYEQNQYTDDNLRKCAYCRR